MKNIPSKKDGNSMNIYVLKDHDEQLRSFGHFFYFPINFVIGIAAMFKRK